MDDEVAERSSQEIKALLRRLDPKSGSHKDRIRRLNKFKNFVTGNGGRDGELPEFYDDDIPLLLLGSSAPAALLGDDPELIDGGLYGLLQACGTPSVEHDQMLKRSARHAMSLLKFLVCDFEEDENGESGDLNLFAQGFCSLPSKLYQHMSLDLHVVGDQRGGAKEDACHVMVLLLTQHTTEDGESAAPMAKDELLVTPQAQQAFEVWLTQNTSRDVQQTIKRNVQARREEIERQENFEAGGVSSAMDHGLDDGGRDHLSSDDDGGAGDFDDDEDIDVKFEDDGGVLAGFRRRKKAARKEVLEATQAGDLEVVKGPALRWEDSQLYREQKARMAAHQRMQVDGEFHDTVRDSQEAAAELAEREEEKAKLLRKDPLGLKGDDFDLRTIQNNQVEYLEQALQEVQEELRKGESGGEDDKTLQAKKESLESILDSLVGMPGAEKSAAQSGRSTIPTDPNFDPLLFLTLVHRKATYEELIGSMDRLSNDTENQVKQLQNMVRENFALFLRCADGIDTFNEKTISQSGPGLVERLGRLDALAESCAHQAKKSFKPLLDNASEVRKVQSALAVLQRVAPMLQAPYLMRQHIENGRFSQALKAYRRVLVIDEHCNIHLLNHVKAQAAECAREAQRELESRLAQDKLSVSSLLDAVRDLGELLEFDIPHDPKESAKLKEEPYQSNVAGTFVIGNVTVNTRDHPPALACLLLQAAHLTAVVSQIIDEVETTTIQMFEGEVQGASESSDKKDQGSSKAATSANNQWKYDVLEARGMATIKAVEVIHTWLPRLLHIAKTAKEDEKRRAARVSRKRASSNQGMDNHLTPFEVLITNIAPSFTKLVEHVAFCGLGSAPRGAGLEIKATFGKKAADKLRTLLRSPLPPSQSSRVGKEMAGMVEVLNQSTAMVNELRPINDSKSLHNVAPFDTCKALAEQSVVTIEKRRSIYSFDICARTCSNKASGSGKFDADALLTCLRTLSEELTRPDQCATEVEKGCELVVRRCADGLANYVRDRGDSARLSAVAECADVLANRISDVVREVAFLTNNAEAVEEVMLEDIMGLEGAMFDEYLENIRANVSSCCRMTWLDIRADPDQSADIPEIGFPPYLSSSLLAIVRCRAQVEQALGNKVRRTEDATYQHIAMATISEGVVESLCHEIHERKSSIKVRQADRLANELQFLMNTLKNYLSKEAMSHLDGTRRVMCSKAGRGGGIQGDGPDGLAALEDLERLGRVYVLCLGE